MPTTQTVTTFKFDELDDSAKEKARDWWREASVGDDYWSEHVLDECKTTIAKGLGLDIDAIYFSGFSSQGDGACFVGSWRARDVNLQAVNDYAPQDAELWKVACEFNRLAQLCPQASFSVEHSGRYCHEHSTEFSVDLGELADEWLDVLISRLEEEIIDVARDYMRYIYRRLEKEYEWYMSDEQVDESINANEYDFCEDGSRYRY